MKELSKVQSSIPGRGISKLRLSNKDITSAAVRELNQIGIVLDAKHLAPMVSAYTADDSGMIADYGSTLPGLTQPRIGVPVQFLQTWLPGFVEYMTTVRTIDELVGVATVGEWEDEEVVQRSIETLGQAAPYGDRTNIPLANHNEEFETRNVVRFEAGFSVGLLEDARNKRAGVDSAAIKRNGCGSQLEITRNSIGFRGYNSGRTRTFGVLNDPGLLPAITVPAGASGGTSWATKTYNETVSDIVTAISQLHVQSGGNIKPEDLDLTLALPLGVSASLSKTTDYGMSVKKWLADNYPRLRLVSIPEFMEAVGGVNVAYLFAETVDDTSTDDRSVFMQMVPTKFKTLFAGWVEKHFVEDFGNATAGVMLKRPTAVVRLLGV